MHNFSLPLAMLILLTFVGSSSAQLIRPLRPFNVQGTVKKVVRNGVLVEDRSGRAWQLRLPADNGVVLLSKKQKFQSQKAVIEISGSLNPSSLEEKAPVRVECYVNDKGQVGEPVAEIKWLDKKGFKAATKLNRKKKNDRGEQLCLVMGTVDKVDPDGFMVKVPKSRLASKGSMAIPFSKEAKVIVKTRDLSRVKEGDRVTEVTGFELSSGDFVVSKIAIQLSDKASSKPSAKGSRSRRKAPTSSPTESVDSRYLSLSDEPVDPRSVAHPLIKMKSDVSERDARIMQDEARLLVEWLKMGLRMPVRSPFECYLVDDLKRWPDDQFSDEIKSELESKRGITVPQASNGSAGKPKKSIVYSPNNKRAFRAELVRAYCYQAWGGLGPDWLSEGLAEMGRNLKQPMNEVNLDSKLITVLKKGNNRRTLKQVISGEKTKPEEQTRKLSEKVLKMKAERRANEELAYKWALCYLLANNRNYSRKFPEYVSGLISERPGASFSKTYGSVSKELTFEYDQFSKNAANGYRMDLCTWNWKHRFKTLDKSSTEKFTVKAKLGWQPAVSVEEGQSYEIVAKGKWRVDGAGTTTDGDGADGKGKLVGVVMEDYKLSEVIPIGKAGEFRAATNGQLYLRCDEAWGAIADNADSLNVYIRQAKK